MVKNYDSLGDPRSVLFSLGITSGVIVLTIALEAVNICMLVPRAYGILVPWAYGILVPMG